MSSAGNVFDQFDSSSNSANPFDQFDNSSKAPPKPTAPPPNTYADIVKSAATGLAKGSAALVGLPGDVGKLEKQAVQYIGNKISPGAGDTAKSALDSISVPLPSSAQVNSGIQSLTGQYHTPQTTAGNYAQTIASFVPAALGGEGSLALRVVKRVLIPGATSEAAGEIPGIAGTAAEPYVRAGAALVGGAAPSIASVGLRMVNRGAAALNGGAGFLDPNVTAADRLTQSLATDGGIPAASAKNASFVNSGASTPTVLDIGGGATRRLVRAAAGGGDGPAQNIATNYADQVRANLQDNVIDRANQLTPNDPRTPVQAATDARTVQRTQAATDYAGPATQPVQLTPEAVNSLSGQTGQQAITRAMRDAEINRDADTQTELTNLQTIDPNNPPVVTGRALDAIRQAYRGMAEDVAARPGNNYAQAGYLGRMGDLDTALDQAQGIGTARQNFRTNQAAVDAPALGGRVLNSPSGQYADQIAQLSGVGGPPDMRGLQVGARSAIVNSVEAPAAGQTGVLNKLGSGTRATQNLAATFGPEQGAQFQEAVRNEVQRLRNANFISPETGSQTQGRTSDMASLVSAAHNPVGAFVSHVFDTIRRGVSLTPAEREAIVRMGTSEADLRQIAARAVSHRANPAATNALLLNQSQAQGQ